MAQICILGGGFIGRFYADSLTGRRGKDQVSVVYARKEETAIRFAKDFQVAHYTTNMEEAIAHPATEFVVIALPNYLHEEAVMLCVKHKKAVLCTKPLGRTADEALRMTQACEKAGIFAGYLEDLCYTPKFLKSLKSIQSGALGRILWAKSRETHPGPHSDWFWDIQKAGGGAVLDLGCHCIEIARNFIGKDVKPVEVMCWADTQVKPIDAEDHAIGLVKYENGAIGQFEVSWTFRGGMDLRDEVMGTEGTIWINSFLRTGFEMFTSGAGKSYVAEKAESDSGWQFPVGDEAHELGYTNMFTDMFDAYEKGESPMETFYDGYVVNAIIDAAYRSAKTKLWEPVQLPEWRGQEGLSKPSVYQEYDADHWFIKEEILPNGDKKVILKVKATGEIIEKETWV
ncbi:Gfo/Idh/MocA family oxidoreductase [Aquirufa nivalisilvae]|uniref:Gfo/Idh/MocA family protein n=1 Tax=Aquirufa nivalisilvae TaxID=2516557 RepID=UPI0022A9B50F|nr:Gfo/Idh/MocA family oxidoreductase [Aquirufa nivalisilvae]MCZ2479445.1 Gfo/Idh/MocA family oxidoreductase [Aquirufa nivalisilvae]MCZ2481431.1 Gfo/Idh/MocA family oxidoreductase [Aquirufa nivalisilvae]